LNTGDTRSHLYTYSSVRSYIRAALLLVFTAVLPILTSGCAALLLGAAVGGGVTYYKSRKARARARDDERKLAGEALAYFKTANSYFDEGEYDLAIDSYTLAIESEPAFASAYCNRGLAYAEKSQYELAIIDQGVAIALRPDFATAYWGRGVAAYHQADYEQALGDLDKAIELDPHYVEAYYFRGLVHEKMGERELAVEDLSRAVDLAPDDLQARAKNDELVAKLGPPGAEADPGEKRWALVIGINDYQAAGKLKFCREDAEALSWTLYKKCSFSPSRVVTLVDATSDPEKWPTRGNIRRRIDQFSTLPGPDDVVLVFFSGHGMLAEDEGYLMPVDADRDPANNIELAWVNEKLEACAAKEKVLILDVCHAGAAKGVGGIVPPMREVLVIGSCEKEEISYYDEEMGHGVFTARLIQGLTGGADGNGDGSVTTAELVDFLKKQMAEWSLATGKTQTPVIYGLETGDTVLSETR